MRGIFWRNALWTYALAALVLGAAALAQTAVPGAPLMPAPAASFSAGTAAGQVLTWVVTVFGVPIGGLVTACLYRLLQRLGINLTDAQRARLRQIVLNAMHLGANLTEQEIAGKGEVEVKNLAVAKAVNYAQAHGADTLKALVGSSTGQLAVEGIKAQIAVLAADPAVSTPKVFDPQGITAPAAPAATVAVPVVPVPVAA